MYEDTFCSTGLGPPRPLKTQILCVIFRYYREQCHTQKAIFSFITGAEEILFPTG